MADLAMGARHARWAFCSSPLGVDLGVDVWFECLRGTIWRGIRPNMLPNSAGGVGGGE
jgi:hypothetical protein